MKRKHMLLSVFIGIVLLLVIVIAMQPANFQITRSARISASPEIIYANVNDLHKWNAWSPWARLDPNCKMTFEGPGEGVGAGYTWAGNKEVGEGRMVITESRAGDLIRFRLEFLKPMTATNDAEFTFKAADANGNRTDVTWTMSGKNGFIGKAFGLFVNCDKMVGGDFQKGLASLKNIAEAEAKK